MGERRRQARRVLTGARFHSVAGVRWWIGAAGSRAGTKHGRLAALLTDRNGREADFTFTEELRPGAREIVQDLRRDGVVHAALLSGDAREPVERLAKSLAFDEARGRMTAADKLEWIRTRPDRGERLLFVGDGLNDAPTLAAAGVSASFAEAPQLSRLSSDFLLL